MNESLSKSDRNEDHASSLLACEHCQRWIEGLEYFGDHHFIFDLLKIVARMSTFVVYV